MSIKKEKILFTGRELNLNFNLSSNIGQTGYQQEIDEYTNLMKYQNINDPVDNEVKRFKFNSTTPIRKLNFQFYERRGYRNSFYYSDFDVDEIEQLKLPFTNSFFILDVFDTNDPTNQTKMFSTYLNKIYENNLNDDPTISSYEIDQDFQIYYLNPPIYFITPQSGQTTSFVWAYGRFSFYNSKLGTVKVFYNQDYENSNSQSKMFFEIKLDFNDKTWDIITRSNSGTEPEIIAKELTNSQDYIEKYNNTFDNFTNQLPNIPSGTTFNYLTGKYQ